MGEEEMTKWFWFSFADDTGFLGATIVNGEDFTAAHQETHRRGVNPGGEVKSLELAGCKGADDLLPYVPFRLYSKAEIDAIDGAEKF